MDECSTGKANDRSEKTQLLHKSSQRPNANNMPDSQDMLSLNRDQNLRRKGSGEWKYVAASGSLLPGKVPRISGFFFNSISPSSNVQPRLDIGDVVVLFMNSGEKTKN
jgi:hypothetical protein